MKHDHCTHESTPKARSVCRRGQQISTQMTIETGVIIPRAKRTVAKLDAVVSELHKDVPRKKLDPGLITNLALMRKFGAPREWDHVVTRAIGKGWQVSCDRREDDDTRGRGGRLIIDMPGGLVELVWGGTKRAYWFTPFATSVSRPVASVGIAMTLGEN
jgi:hypothetical protein